MSRFWGGVHFLASLDAGEQVCRTIGDTSYEYLKQHIDGRGAVIAGLDRVTLCVG